MVCDIFSGNSQGRHSKVQYSKRRVDGPQGGQSKDSLLHRQRRSKVQDLEAVRGAGMTEREKDARFAEKVLGVVVEKAEDGSWPCIRRKDEGGIYWDPVPTYGESLNDVWPGVEKLQEAGLRFSLYVNSYGLAYEFLVDREGCEEFIVESETPARAVRDACLRAVGGAG